MTFDYEQFYDTFAEKMNDTYPKAIHYETGLSLPMITKLKYRRGASLQTVLKVCIWMGVSIYDFVSTE